MFWSQNKKNAKKKDSSVGAVTNPWGKKVVNQYESYEISFRQESEIHRQWQRIEDVALSLKRRYEGKSEVIEYIEMMCSAEKVFAAGQIKHWSSEQIREELVRDKIADMSGIGGLDKDFSEKIYEAFKSLSVTAARVDEVTKMLLEKYADHKEYCAFVVYLHDVYIAYMQSAERGEDNNAFKDRLIRIRMEVVSTTQHISISDLDTIYEEFKTALAMAKS